MIKLFNKQTNEFLGRIDESELQFLREHLEEESLEDRDYYLISETVEEFTRLGASPRLIDILKQGLHGSPTLEIRWEPD